MPQLGHLITILLLFIIYIFIHQNMGMIFSAQNGKIGFNKGFLNLINPEDFDKINKAIQLYNQRVNSASGNQAIFAESMKRLNPQLRNYLVGLDGAKASMKGYGVHLVGATIKTVALQAASMALNAALTWGVSLAIQGLVELGKYLWKLVPTTEHLKGKLEETAQALADIKSEREGLNDELKTTQERIAELEAKGVLSFTDEAELNRLNKENAALKTKIELLDIEAKKNREQNQKNFNELIDKKETNTSNTSWASIDYNGNTEKYRNITDKEKLLELAKIYDEVTESKKDYLDARGFSHSIEDVENEITNFSSVVQEYQGYLDDLYQDGFDYNSADEKTKQNIDFANEMIDRYMVLVGKTATAWERAYNSDRFNEARTAIEELANGGNLTAESLQNLYNQGGNVKEFIDYMLSLNTVDWKTMLGDKFEDIAGEDGIVSLDEALKAMSGDTELASKVMGLFANELNKVEEATDDAAGATDNLANKFKKLSEAQKGIKSINDAIKDLRDDGHVSFNTLSDIQENFSNLGVDSGKLSEYISQLAKATSESEISEILTDLSNAAIDAKYSTEELANADENVIAAMLREAGVANALEVAHARVTEAKILNILNSKDLKNATLDEVNQLLAEANILPITASQYQIYRAKKIAANAVTANNSKSISALLTEANAANNLGKGYAVLQKLKDAYDTFEKTKDPRGKSALASRISSLKQELQQVLNSVSIKPVTITYSGGSYSSSSSSSSSSTDKHKDEFDDWLAELKHRLEMDEITQEQYLDELNKKYQKYFSDLTKYQEEYWKYQEEVYDGVKELYKEELEAQKEALEEKLDALKEFYDEQKKMLEDQFEEEDYLKEQAEKRRAVTDIETQILLLSSDNSAWAQKRILELQEELQSANEELAEFEKDKYREDATQMYDDLYSAAKEETNNKIQAIDDILNDSNAVQKEILKRIDYMSNGGALGDYSDWLSSSGSTSSGSSGSTDTSISIPDSEKVSLLSGDIGKDSSKAKLKILQSALNDLGYDCGVVDGIWGTKTANALKAFQKANGLTADGVCGSATKAKFALKGYAQGTRYAPEGLAITDENGYEMKLINPSRGKYQLLNQGDVIFNAAQSSFLWGLSKNPNGVLANLMSSILHRAPTLGGLTTASVQHIDIDTGDVIIQGNADEKTVSEIRRVKREMVNDVLKAFKQYAK